MELLNEERSASSFRMRPKQPKCKIIGTSIICRGKVGRGRRKLLEKQLEHGRGPNGRPGPPGMQGMPGPQGQKGERGFPGRPGGRGEEGPIGPPGSRGMEGPRGDTGDKGDSGRTGAQGFPGIPGNCKMITPTHGQSCERGPRGPEGVKGSIGQEGNVGPEGDKGHQGQIGKPGTRGSSGPPGTIGPHGTLELNGPCRRGFSEWVIPNRSPMSFLKTNCTLKEFLKAIEVQSKGPRIRYQYKCCPFLAESLDRFILPIPP